MRNPTQNTGKILYIGETKQPLHKQIAQLRRATSFRTGLGGSPSPKGKRARVLAGEDRWFERGDKEAIRVKLEKTILKQRWCTLAVPIPPCTTQSSTL